MKSEIIRWSIALILLMILPTVSFGIFIITDDSPTHVRAKRDGTFNLILKAKNLSPLEKVKAQISGLDNIQYADATPTWRIVRKNEVASFAIYGRLMNISGSGKIAFKLLWTDNEGKLATTLHLVTVQVPSN